MSDGDLERTLGPVKLLVPLVAVCLAAGACGGGSTTAAPATGQPSLARTADATSCPAVRKPRFDWPAGYPQDLPQPPGATFGQVTKTSTGLVVTRFSTATDLRTSVLFVVQALPKAGFTLGRGDAEPAEADAPFVREDLRGVMKMQVVSPCSTNWLVAVTKAASTSNSPLLPTPSHSGSPTPLPFG